MTFTAIFEEVSEAEGGGFVAYVEELPGAITQGDTLEEARENLRDAVAELLAANREQVRESRHGGAKDKHKVIREPFQLSP